MPEQIYMFVIVFTSLWKCGVISFDVERFWGASGANRQANWKSSCQLSSLMQVPVLQAEYLLDLAKFFSEGLLSDIAIQGDCL